MRHRLYGCLFIFFNYLILSNGVAEQAFGARILRHVANVGAIRSTVIGVSIFSGFMLLPKRNKGKGT